MKQLMKGNDAIAEAAVRADCQMYVGYPITPQSEIVEYMASRMPELGRVFVQSESELISINTVIGGALTGKRCMTSSSGVGISLMQEGLSDAFAKGLPMLLVNVNRCSCGMGGDFGGSTDDYLRDTRGGGNGDYHFIVYVPNTVQEAVDLVYDAWDVAEKYRNPVEIMTEGRLGQMMETVEFPEFKKGPEKLDWASDGTTKPLGEYQPMPLDDAACKRRIDRMREAEQRWEMYRVEDAETVIVACGLASRVCMGAIDELRERGVKIGMLRVISAWPFPIKGFAELPDCVKRIACIEVDNDGQVIEDVLITTKKLKRFRNTPIFNFYQLHLFTPETVEEFINGVLEGKIEEV